MTKRIVYLSSAVTTEFTATDGTNFKTVPAADIAIGGYGYCVVFNSREDAEEWDSSGEVHPMEIDEEDDE